LGFRVVNRKIGEITAKKQQIWVITDHILPILAQNLCSPRKILKNLSCFLLLRPHHEQVGNSPLSHNVGAAIMRHEVTPFSAAPQSGALCSTAPDGFPA
jgi:hypothetical protein